MEIPVEEVVMKLIEKYWGYLLLIIVIIFLIISGNIKSNKIDDLKVENNILSVLQDSLKVYKNKLGQVVYEKNAFNVELSALKKAYGKMDANNKDLVNTIYGMEKRNKLLTVTNIHLSATIDSLLNTTPIIDEERGLLTFKDDSKYLQYTFVVDTKSPSLLIQNLNLPNKISLSHKFTQEGIVVSVMNSNEKYFKVNDVNSYVIPLKKDKNNFGKIFTVGAISFGAGAIGTFLLLK